MKLCTVRPLSCCATSCKEDSEDAVGSAKGSPLREYRSSHLFIPMPDVIREDMTFLHRIHFYIPGWEMPKMKVEYFTNHYGFVVEYPGDALRELREHRL